jgi:hypothetical protein
VTAARPSRFRKPASAPSAADLAERDRYAKLAAGSADAVRSSAKIWQAALTAFISLITAGVIIKGRDSTTDLTTGWRTAIVALVGGGLVLAVLGLWQTVAAEAGTHPETKTLQEIRDAHGTLDAYQVYLAVRAARRLRWGIRSAAGAMTLLIAGVVATWVAPAAPHQGTYLAVTHGRSVTCGTPITARSGEIRLAVPGQNEPVTIQLGQVTAVTLTTACP